MFLSAIVVVSVSNPFSAPVDLERRPEEEASAATFGHDHEGEEDALISKRWLTNATFIYFLANSTNLCHQMCRDLIARVLAVTATWMSVAGSNSPIRAQSCW